MAIALFVGNHRIRTGMGVKAAADLEREGRSFYAISVGSRVELEGDRAHAKKRPGYRAEKEDQYPEDDCSGPDARPSPPRFGNRRGRERDRANGLSRALRCTRVSSRGGG